MNTIDIRFPDDGSIIDVEGLVIPNDSTTVVYGPNGAGQTTLLRRLAGIGGTVPMIEAAYQPQQPYMFRGLAGMNLGLGLSPEESGLAGQYILELGIKGLMTEPPRACPAENVSASRWREHWPRGVTGFSSTSH